jgi:hypothetical protein
MNYYIYIDETEKSNYRGLFFLYLTEKQRIDLYNDIIKRRCIKLKNPFENNDCSDCKRNSNKVCTLQIHLKEIRPSNTQKIKIVGDWLDLFSKSKYIFNLIYIPLEDLEKHYGSEKSRLHLEQRFFRSNIKFVVNNFLQDEHVNVINVIHDMSKNRLNPFFKEKNIELLVQDNDIGHKIKFTNKNIHFISSDHSKYNKESSDFIDSHILQYIDCILSSINHNYFHDSLDSKIRLNLAEAIHPLVKDLSNFKTAYQRKQNIGFLDQNQKNTDIPIFNTKEPNIEKFLNKSLWMFDKEN